MSTASEPDHRYFERFGVTQELMRKTMAEAMASGGEWADLYFQHSTYTSVGLEDHVVNRASTGVDLGVGIRVVVGDQTGYAFTHRPIHP